MAGKVLVPPTFTGDRRREPRWRDKRLVALSSPGAEHVGLTGDISRRGMRIGLPCGPGQVEDEVEAAVAFAQDVIEVRARVVYAREMEWGTLIGLCFHPGQEAFVRFVSRRYAEVAPTPTEPGTYPPPWQTYPAD